MKKIFNFLKNTLAIISLFFLSVTIMMGSFDFSDEAWIVIGSVSFTILTIFIYSKIARKFNL